MYTLEQAMYTDMHVVVMVMVLMTVIAMVMVAVVIFWRTVT